MTNPLKIGRQCWKYLSKGWHPLEDKIKVQNKLPALDPSVTEVTLSYVCQLSWLNSPRRTYLAFNGCLVEVVGEGWALKGAWFTVAYIKPKTGKNTSDTTESTDHNRSVQMYQYLPTWRD